MAWCARLEHTAREATQLGATIELLTPKEFRTLPMPTYPEIRLALTTSRMIARRLRQQAPDFVHIATEGPIGIMTRGACLAQGRVFTTSYHTRFPEYLAARASVPQRLSYAWLRRFHNAAAGMMISTDTLETELRGRGFRNIMRWSRGVHADLFRPRTPDEIADPALHNLPRPVFLYVGRVSVEKNIEALPRARSAGHQAHCRRRPGARRIADALSGRPLPRAARGREPGAGLFRRRRLRVPEPHRHLRHRAAGSAGERPPGRRLPGHRAGST